MNPESSKILLIFRRRVFVPFIEVARGENELDPSFTGRPFVFRVFSVFRGVSVSCSGRRPDYDVIGFV